MITNTSNSKLPTSIISLGNKQHQQQQQNHQQQQHQHISSNSTSQSHHQIPPRYQPPPQPHGGILKNIGLKPPYSYYPSELNAPHLNIKYPPEVPKLTNIYLPEGIKGSGIPNSSRLVPPRVTGTRTSLGGVAGPGNGGSQLRTREEEFIARQNSQAQQQQQEMLKFVRKSEGEPSPNSTGSGATANPNQGRLSAEQNRHFQNLVAELRALKEANQRLSDDNQELRDLCCFLDDDRQKGRKLAREWQRFGRYTASVMRQEVSAYQNKLRQLDDKQQELIRDNLELKELCLYLDEERVNAQTNAVCTNCGISMGVHLRDDGDGSSSSTNADETMMNMRQFDRNDLSLRSTLSDQTLQYVRSLERRIRQLEEEVTTNATPTNNNGNDPISGRPEAVVRALQVLEVREQLEKERVGSASTPSEQTMDDGEKALVREMCNVVWRKLEDGTNGPSGMDHL